MAEQPANASNSWGGWFSNIQENAKVLAARTQEAALATSKIVQEKAVTLAERANEMRQNYDMEVATSILMSTVGASDGSVVGGESEKRAETKTRSTKLDLAYVTENLISMAFPYDADKLLNNATIEAGNDIDVVSSFLRKRHSGHFMIWNISEEGYDYSKFDNQVLEYKFPGHPSPPLGLLFKICSSIESWLDADEENVAVIHCLTGKGRTAALMACVLTWIGEFNSPMEALQYVADRRSISVDHLTIPSQRRYVQYFSNMLDGVKPRSEPLLLRRIIMNSIPIFGTNSESEGSLGCCPYIQLFKNGNLIATAAPVPDANAVSADGESSGETDAAVPPPTNKPHGKQKMQLRWISASEGSVSFTVDAPIQGDILLRCRHSAASGARVSCFRAAFHTGYVPSGVLRLTKAQLDGSSTDARFDEEFFIDLIFAPISAGKSTGDGMSASSSSNALDTAISDSGLTLDAVSADKYELTIHKDVRFWDSVNQRKQKIKKRRSRKYVSQQQEVFKISEDDDGEHSPSTGDISFVSKAVGGGFSGFATSLGVGSSSSSSSGSGREGSSAAGGGVASAAAAKNSASGLTDEELIMQLSSLDMDMDMGVDVLDSSPPSTTGGGGGASFGGDTSSNNSGARTESDSGGFEVVRSGSLASVASAANNKASSMSSELQALEDLEKELGLGDLNLFTATIDSNSTSTADLTTTPAGKHVAGPAFTPAPAATTTSTPAASTLLTPMSAATDELDDLEDFLNNLS